MTITPDDVARRQSAHQHPPLDLSIVDSAGAPHLSLRDTPQTLTVALVNRGSDAIVTSRSSRFMLTFRPNTLASVDEVNLAADSSASWVLVSHQDGLAEQFGEIDLNLGITVMNDAVGTVAFAPKSELTLHPGMTAEVRLEGIRANPTGGSRATRVMLAYENVTVAGQSEPIQGSRMQRLDVGSADEAALALVRSVRRGSTFASGPFTAGFMGSSQVLNDGKSINRVRVRIANTSGRPLVLSDDEDRATRLELKYETGSDSTPWGLLGSVHDHLAITTITDGWAASGTTARCVDASAWGLSDHLEFEIDMHSSAPEGVAQLIVHYSNVPNINDGELVLLVELAKTAHGVFVTPVNLYGDGASITFHDGEYLDSETSAAASIALDHSEAHDPPLVIDSSGGVIVGTETTLNGGVTANGGMTAETPVSVVSADNQTPSVTVGAGGRIEIPDTPESGVFRSPGTAGGSFLVPAGAIMMWHGEHHAIPQGWALCDGRNGTPDLRSRFVIGATFAGSPPLDRHGLRWYRLADAGGAETHQLRMNEMPKHNHNWHFHDPGHRHWFNKGFRDAKTDSDDQQLSVWEQTTRQSTDQSFTGIDIRHEASGGNQPHENMPPYRALFYIMKLPAS